METVGIKQTSFVFSNKSSVEKQYMLYTVDGCRARALSFLNFSIGRNENELK